MVIGYCLLVNVYWLLFPFASNDARVQVKQRAHLMLLMRSFAANDTLVRHKRQCH